LERNKDRQDFPDLPPERVYLVQYYDPIHDANGQPCTAASVESSPGDWGWISQDDWQWFHAAVLAGINAEIAKATAPSAITSRLKLTNRT
jgi:hypothetical protein